MRTILHDLLLPFYVVLIGLCLALYSRWRARRDRTRRGKAAVFEKVRDRFTSEEDMIRWYETEALSGWGGKTAKNLLVLHLHLRSAFWHLLPPPSMASKVRQRSFR
jgi:hypothetical protein